MGAWAFLGLTTVLVTKTLTFKQAMVALTNDAIWLIVISFFFAKVRTSTTAATLAPWTPAALPCADLAQW